jgi:hypothetical protein
MARKQLDRLVPPGQAWHLDAVRIVDGGEQTHWLYEVSFRRDYPGAIEVFGGDYLDILVLMDGTVIEPQPSPRPGPDHPRSDLTKRWSERLAALVRYFP